MDRSLTSARGAPTLRLLGSVRNRLLARKLCDSAVGSAWAGALLVIGGGIAHLAILADSGRATLWLAPMLVAATLAIGLARRPSLERAAREADVRFEGRGLLVSALDQLLRRPADRAGMAEFVIASADAAATAWRRRPSAGAPGLRPVRLYAPLFACSFGLFLHALPGAGSGHSAAVATGRTSELTSRDPAAHSKEPSWKILTEPDPVSTPPSHTSPAPSAGGPTRAAPAPEDEPLPEAAAPSSDAIVRQATSAGGKGIAAGDAEPSDVSSQSRNEHTPLAVDYRETVRGPGRHGGGVGEFDGLGPADEGQRPQPSPAGSVDVPRLELGPDLRAYIGAYLRERRGAP